MDSLRQDIRYAIRALLNRPWLSALAVLTLAIGIGVNTVAYSAINALLGKPMRFAGARELGWIQTHGGKSPYKQTALPDYLDLVRENRTFEAIIAEARIPLSMQTPGGAEQVWSLLVSGNYLTALGARPLVGRLLTASDGAGVELAVVVSERFWRERLDGGPLAGRTLTLNGRLFSIAGVIPEGFQGPGGLYEPDLWLPLERLELLGLSAALTSRDEPWLTVAGRMKPDITPGQAQADLRGIMTQLALAYPASNAGRSVTFIPVSDGVPELRALARVAWIGLAVVGIVLLIACFNVAGLLVARASERQREIGVRVALGATRARIVRQLVTEGVILAALSGGAALILSAWSADLLSAFSLPSPIPQRVHIVFDGHLIRFTLMLVAIAGVTPALTPAFQATRADIVNVIRRQSAIGGNPSRTRNLFVVAQVAGSTLFLAAALLFVRSFWNSAAFEPGFDTGHSLVLELNPAQFGYDQVRSQRFFDALVERLRQVPGIEQAALADRAPFSVGFPKNVEISVNGEDCSRTTCRSATEFGVSSGHFAALGLPLISGRELTGQEYLSGAPVAVIGKAMASELWPGTDATGQWIRAGSSGRLVQVIGVAADVKEMYANRAPRWYLYRPLRPAEFRERIAVVVRTAGDPGALTAVVQEQVRALDPALPPGSVSTTRERMKLPLWPARTAAGFLTVCGTLALVLATVGLFGVTYYTVNQRTREFGIRVALGARPRNVMTLVIKEGLMLSAIGVVVGLAGALLAVRVISNTLIGVGPADPPTYFAAGILQMAVAVAACTLPAVRAMRADAMVALRQE
jgi:putative ABC transport system permease protein